MCSFKSQRRLYISELCETFVSFVVNIFLPQSSQRIHKEHKEHKELKKGIL